MVKITIKNIVKAFMPYGVLWAYKKLKQKHKKCVALPPAASVAEPIPHNRYVFDIKEMNPLSQISNGSPKFIVTLTSHGKRVEEKAPYAIFSLFNQSVQPDQIVLWLAYGTKINENLKNLQSIGLDIRFCEDIKSYTKLIPALEAFPYDILVTTDDDVFYPSDWFAKLKEAYINEPEKIHSHRAHEIIFDENKNIVPYNEWRNRIKSIEYSKRIFPTGVGGILYPPNTFNKEVLDKSKFMFLAPSGDDIWFWAMARHNKKEHSIVKNCINYVTDIGKNDDGLWLINLGQNKNDEQIQNVIKAYPDVYKSVL